MRLGPRIHRRELSNQLKMTTPKAQPQVFDSDTVAAVLQQALPYIEKLHDKLVVVKCSGRVLEDPEIRASFAREVVLIHSLGIHLVVVHGGGQQIQELMDKLGLKATFIDGLRVTNAETMEVVQMVLNGQVRQGLVSAINAWGQIAVGASGADARLIMVEQIDEKLGFVGKVKSINESLLHRLLEQRLIPVVSSVGFGDDGYAYNVNADTAAGALAAALNADRFLVLTDVSGVYGDKQDMEAEKHISEMSPQDAKALLESGKIDGGMIPKIEACLNALENGVRVAHLLDGRKENMLLLELFTEEGIGTMIRKGEDE